MWVRLFRGRLPRLFTNSFNSRTRVGATSHHRPAGLPHEVSIHAPVWVRQEGLSSMSSYEGFQFTHPCGCDSVGPVRQGRGMGFNSRTRVGATPADELATSIYTVSIHAPVWVRPYMTELSFWCRRFQFTHPCGCDCGLVTVESVDKVSIHAPVWVRRKPFFGTTVRISFNSRTRVGATMDVV